MIIEVSGQITDYSIIGKKSFRPESRKENPGNDGMKDPVTISVQKPETAFQENRIREDSPEVEELKRREREVRQNAMVHGTSLIYQTGPDGHIYIAGRKVSLDTTDVPNNPKATIDKALAIRRAVNSQKDPSLEDLHKLFAASIMEARARTELLRKSREIGAGHLRVVDKYV